jgi:Mor family transcriptional regulator
MLILNSFCLQIQMNECGDSSKSAVNQKASDVNQVIGRENEDEQTHCSKVVGKRSAEKSVSELMVYELDGGESARKTVKLKCVKIEPRD